MNARVLCPQTGVHRNTYSHTHTQATQEHSGLVSVISFSLWFPRDTHLSLLNILKKNVHDRIWQGARVRGLRKKLVEGKPRTTKIFYLPLLIPFLVSFLLLQKKEAENKASRAAGNSWSTFAPVSIFQADVAGHGDRCRAWTVAHTWPLPSWLVPCAPLEPRLSHFEWPRG